MDKRKMVAGIFWILDNGAKWKDLPAEYEAKSTVHRWFCRWAAQGVWENIMREAGHLVEERDGFRLYECFVDATFSKARQGGDGIGPTKAGKGVKIMLLVDASGLPVAAYTTNASPHESTLVQGLFDFMVTSSKPERIIGDKAYDSDKLDATLAKNDIEMIAPHRSNRRPEISPRTAARCVDTSVVGLSSAQSAGSRTFVVFAPAGRNRPVCFKAFFT